MLNSNNVRRLALEVGFDDCGVARTNALTDDEYPLRSWLSKGWHAGLSYMERNVDKRMDPRLLVPGAKSVICCVSAYPPPSSRGGVAAYARTREYHKVVKDMLFRLRERLGIDGKLCCDTVPISDKHWAARAGLGFIGRHTLLVTPRFGTWVNLGEIVTTEEIEIVAIEETKNENSKTASLLPGQDNPSSPDPHAAFCLKCHRCIDACPNHAIAPDDPPMLDVARCTSYYTTHHPQPRPSGLDAGGYTQGCDLCQLACPFNHRQTPKN